jgi:Na+-transporting NADH:ubiquinone oxidoreductase subunit NqrF
MQYTFHASLVSSQDFVQDSGTVQISSIEDVLPKNCVNNGSNPHDMQGIDYCVCVPEMKKSANHTVMHASGACWGSGHAAV